jgi:dihydroorotate dehydrogenase electron transfer subunit
LVSHSVKEIRVVEVAKVTKECEDVTSLWFRDEFTRMSEPGQYLMVWLPGVDQVPMSVSMVDHDGLSRISVRVVGEMTRRLSELKAGDKVGISGPFGRGYRVEGKSPLVVAGGSGSSSVVPLVKELISKGFKPTVVIGARTESLLIFIDELRSLVGDKLVISTDDGSRGYRGYASTLAAELMEAEGCDSVYTCGPELMMAKVFDSSDKKGLPVQASLERYIKCSVGLCGACAIGPFRVCDDGPVFDTEMLRVVSDEFGFSKMDPSGKRVGV